MSITEKQITNRKNFIGASEIAAVCGLSPWDTAKDIWIKKVYDLKPGKETDPMKRGNYLEDGLLKFAEEEIGLKFEPQLFYLKGIFGATPDGVNSVLVGMRFYRSGCECKSTNLSAAWGEEGTDQVPDYVNLQCQQQCYCADLEMVYVPVILAHFGRIQMRLYKVECNDEVIEKIVKIGTDFWNNHILTRIPPPQETPARIELLKRIEREPKKTIEGIDQLITDWNDTRIGRLLCEKAEDERFAKLLDALGDAEAARLSTGGIFTYLEQKGADCIDRKILQSKYPEIYKEVSHPTTHRVARIKEDK